MRTEKWFPKPAELIALADDIAYATRGVQVALPMPVEASAVDVAGSRRGLKMLVSLGYSKCHPNTLRALNGEALVREKGSVPIPPALLTTLIDELAAEGIEVDPAGARVEAMLQKWAADRTPRREAA